MFLKNTKIAYRLSWGFGLMLLLMVLITALSILSSSYSRGKLANSVNSIAHKTEFIADMRQNLFREGVAARDIGISNDLSQLQKDMDKINLERKLYGENEAKLVGVGLKDEEQTLLTDMHALDQASIPLLQQTQEAVTGFNAGQALKILTTQVSPLHDKWLGDIDKLVALQNTNLQTDLGNFQSESNRTTGLMIVICLIAVAAAGAVAWYLGRTITGPLSDALNMAKKVAAGDLTHRIHSTATDETGQLLSALGTMNDSLVQTISEVRQRATTITQASREIASGNANLSSRTESQASSLEETASAMEQLTATVKQNADHAQHANQLVLSASTVASKGGAIVSNVVGTMGAIKDSSRKIVDIISVIDGIAFQTNILALNAAVEAARAGEQGRGFAVVASEVRNLAQRSASAAKEIKALISASVENVDSGSKLVDDAGLTMTQIVDSVKKVADIMTEISQASREQSTGIEEVNRAIAQMDEMTQQNAAMVEEAAAATESMEEETQGLSDAVDTFKLDHQVGDYRQKSPVQAVVTQARRPQLHMERIES